MAKKLTPRQQRFVDEYILDPNATQAALKSGYSEKTARSIGQNNLTKYDIMAAISEASANRAERTQIDADWLLTRLAQEADADVADLYYPDGGLKPVHEWPDIWRKGLVAGIDTKEDFEYVDGKRKSNGFVVKVRLSDRIKRLELLGKHIAVGAFGPDNLVFPGEIKLVINRPSGD